MLSPQWNWNFCYSYRLFQIGLGNRRFWKNRYDSETRRLWHFELKILSPPLANAPKALKKLLRSAITQRLTIKWRSSSWKWYFKCDYETVGLLSVRRNKAFKLQWRKFNYMTLNINTRFAVDASLKIFQFHRL